MRIPRRRKAASVERKPCEHPTWVPDGPPRTYAVVNGREEDWGVDLPGCAAGQAHRVDYTLDDDHLFPLIGERICPSLALWLYAAHGDRGSVIIRACHERLIEFYDDHPQRPGDVQRTFTLNAFSDPLRCSAAEADRRALAVATRMAGHPLVGGEWDGRP